MTGKISELVSQLIRTQPILIFSKTYCPYCDEAKQLLKSLGYQYHAEELDTRKENDGQLIQDYLYQLTGQKTVPNIFLFGKHYGGCSDLKNLHSTGALKGILENTQSQ